ncbi:hypothetical protein J6590_093380 [Homalodisca vitripennis]|nr:hypothetical protein J6590_093380 [Homalodisca vitripennis]
MKYSLNGEHVTTPKQLKTRRIIQSMNIQNQYKTFVRGTFLDRCSIIGVLEISIRSIE